jgi:hypothetical protein
VNERPTAAAAAVDLTSWDTTTCPECGAIAEVLDRIPVRSTDGWIEHVKIRCVAKHWFFMPLGL